MNITWVVESGTPCTSPSSLNPGGGRIADFVRSWNVPPDVLWRQQIGGRDYHSVRGTLLELHDLFVNFVCCMIIDVAIAMLFLNTLYTTLQVIGLRMALSTFLPSEVQNAGVWLDARPALPPDLANV